MSGNDLYGQHQYQDEETRECVCRDRQSLSFDYFITVFTQILSYKINAYYVQTRAC